MKLTPPKSLMAWAGSLPRSKIHPTTNGGGYSAVVTVYDFLGQAIRQSNPTDTSTAGFGPHDAILAACR
jgi:hypothetical protein